MGRYRFAASAATSGCLGPCAFGFGQLHGPEVLHVPEVLLPECRRELEKANLIVCNHAALLC